MTDDLHVFQGLMKAICKSEYSNYVINTLPITIGKATNKSASNWPLIHSIFLLSSQPTSCVLVQLHIIPTINKPLNCPVAIKQIASFHHTVSIAQITHRKICKYQFRPPKLIWERKNDKTSPSATLFSTFLSMFWTGIFLGGIVSRRK